MSLRQGLNLVAGACTMPYINPNTHNWEIMGQDTGSQAVPFTITIEEYNRKVQDGSLDPSIMYHISDNIPRLVRGITLVTTNWVESEDYVYYNIAIDGIQDTDIAMVELSSHLSDSDYIDQFDELDNSSVKRIKADTGVITIMAKSRPTRDIVVDVAFVKCIIVS